MSEPNSILTKILRLLTNDISEYLSIIFNTFATRIFLEKLKVAKVISIHKAFDLVDHEILLKKLWHYGIRGIANGWFKSYLTNRMQYVSINGISSDLLKVNFGVPRGSLFGHLLFLLYINDLHNSIRFYSPFHFADDTGLLKHPRQHACH